MVEEALILKNAILEGQLTVDPASMIDAVAGTIWSISDRLAHPMARDGVRTSLSERHEAESVLSDVFLIEWLLFIHVVSECSAVVYDIYLVLCGTSCHSCEWTMYGQPMYDDSASGSIA